jgi:2'-5' RNA ligase
MNAKTHTTAIVIIPLESLWEPIQAIRRQHDRNLRRWMPHITLLYPFVPVRMFTDAVPLLHQVSAEISPFVIILRQFALFAHGRRSATLYLAPEPAEPLIELQTRLWEAFPAYADTRRHQQGFTPHLSVGQAPGVAAGKALIHTLATDWSALSFTVAAIHLIARGGPNPPDDVFQIVQTVVFGG